MNTAQLLEEAYTRIRGIVHRAVDGLTGAELGYRVDPQANSIAWLVWHLSRVQDDHVSEVAGLEQVWTAQGWADRFALPFAVESIGYGHTSEEVAAVQVDGPDLLIGYHDAVYEQTTRFVRGLVDADLDRIVDESWDPPVSLGVRLVSVINDGMQHAGQAGFVRGIVQRRAG